MPGPDAKKPEPPNDPEEVEIGHVTECWCDDACRYVDLKLDRREERERLEGPSRLKPRG